MFKLYFELTEGEDYPSLCDGVPRYANLNCKIIKKKIKNLIYKIFISAFFCISISALIKLSSLFKHGINSKDSPPCSKNSSLDSLPISSIVSRQSDEKPGQKTCMFLKPSFGNSSSLDDKYGLIHSALPNLD